MEDVLKLINEVVVSIRSKDNACSYFSQEELNKFEFMFELCLNIIRYELQLSNRLSDSTADAMAVMFGFMALEYYKKDYPEVDKKCEALFNKLIIYNEKLSKHDLRRKIGLKDIEWARFYKRTISKLLLNNRVD
ncbi:hypothetical protein [Chitinophaga sp. S165]|uniref:hypothetical protein n=1 Tax=Chitinophaga sp. S165 TaxID=2135462 RepID=UPI000D709F9D|nr:hypothetical protein [Chitinophaga sp. S165]PWV55764.1 hypothetical protein C7475_101271 [Chitinophaga sp. S165]